MTSEEKFSRLAPSFLPATAVLEMTYKCNHACIFCSCPWFARRLEIHREMDITEWQKYISMLCDMGVCNFAFTGGEPLLKKGILQLIEFAANCVTEHIETVNGELVSKKAPPDLYLLSNGKAMTEEVLKMCAKYSVNLSLSLPGLTTLKKHTKSGDTKNILQWFTRAKNFDVKTTVGITVTRQNIFELYETISEALLAGADNLLLNRFMPGGRGLKYADELILNKEEIVHMLDTAEEVLETANRNGSVGTEIPKCIFDSNKYTRLKVGTRCSAALDFFVIDPSGYIRVCNHSQQRLDHISRINDLKDNPYWKKFVFKEYMPPKCFDCDQNRMCDAGCREAAHIVNGELDSLDPVLI